MTFDPTTLPACTQEDGSDPGQTFPCGWDAATHGNGQGDSFVMNAPQSWLYADGTLICGRDLQATDDMLACEPITETVSAANDVPAAPLTATEQVLAQPAPPAELAHTGLDPAGALMASVLVVVGALCLVGRRVLTRSS